jgi:hypothetical protein
LKPGFRVVSGYGKVGFDPLIVFWCGNSFGIAQGRFHPTILRPFTYALFGAKIFSLVYIKIKYSRLLKI